jgi:hypothetical protein
MSSKQACCGSAMVVWVLVVALGFLHHDFWWWDDNTLFFGFMPMGLAYHALFSLLAAGVWALALRWAWPHDLEKMAEEASESIPPAEVTEGDASDQN